MGNLITNPKTYTGQEMEQIFFRPSFSGESARDLGIRVITNLPVDTTFNFWKRRDSVLSAYQTGFQGGQTSLKYQKKIEYARIKAEQKFSASDYFSTVFEKITDNADVNMQDLTGTDIERAETELFRQAIAEDVRVTMWVGDTDGTLSGKETFDGFLKRASTYTDAPKVPISSAPAKTNIIALLDSVWAAASQELKSLKSTGKLVYYVTSDVYQAYQVFLDGYTNSVAYRDIQNGLPVLNYHGIELHEIQVESFLTTPASIVLLTHKENLVLAINTRDLPDAEIRMWYNPDAMENRQRAVFKAATEILDESLIVYASTTVEAEAASQE